MLICGVLVVAGAVSVVPKLLLVYRSASYASRPARRDELGKAGLID